MGKVILVNPSIIERFYLFTEDSFIATTVASFMFSRYGIFYFSWRL